MLLQETTEKLDLTVFHMKKITFFHFWVNYCFADPLYKNFYTLIRNFNVIYVLLYLLNPATWRL